MYVNLRSFDPPTYCVLLQTRVSMTGVAFQIIFKQQLSMIQWGSIILLTIGCVVKQASFDQLPKAIYFSPEIALILTYLSACLPYTYIVAIVPICHLPTLTMILCA